MGTTFAVVFVALYAAHLVMDHWGQTSHQAANKGRCGSRTENRAGRLACASHVATYTAGTALTTLLVALVFADVAVSPLGFVVGQAVSALTHYWADRRHTLARLAAATGKAGFYALGAPRPGRDDNPSLGTGSYALDQSWHIGWLAVSAFLTALLGG
ncbi:transcriptional regulator [Allokutzneria oryzae]|uniref:Transcriptional regulator n=1 Tax=Allokutzneria oryzae TaxID=1378989 RepID=A0ABV5ZZG0_9PSEU